MAEISQFFNIIFLTFISFLLNFKFISQWVDENKGILCGNSIHIDRRYIHKEMPKLDNYLSYRMIDVSSFKEVIKRWFKPNENEPSKKNNHLALVSKNEKLLIFETSSLPTLNKGAGVQLMKIKDKDFIIDTSVFDYKEGLSWRKASKTKNLRDVQFWKGKRAQVGKKIPKGFNKNLKFNS